MPQENTAAYDLEDPSDGKYQNLEGKEETGSPNSEPREKAPEGRPWFVMPVLTTSIAFSSVAGPIMKMMESDGVAPLALGAWRHEVSATLMFPFAIWQWFSMSSEARSKVLTWRNFGTISLCAFGLAAHFGFLIWSLDNTALTHSLFLCILSPIFVTLFTFISNGTLLRGELLGVSLGLIGSAILAAGAKVEKDNEFTIVGDLAALTSACGFAVYLVCGTDLRGKLPLFVYLWPVNVMVVMFIALAQTFLQAVGAVNEYHDVGLFSWITQGGGYIGRTLILGLGPGFLCHAGYNISMGYVKPLIISVAFSISPLLGSLVGWGMGETGIPGLVTLFGGLVTMGATIWVSHASSSTAKATSQRESTSDEKLPLNDES